MPHQGTTPQIPALARFPENYVGIKNPERFGAFEQSADPGRMIDLFVNYFTARSRGSILDFVNGFREGLKLKQEEAAQEKAQLNAAAKAAADRAQALKEIEGDVNVHGDSYENAFMRRAHRILPPREYGDYMAKIRETTPEVLETMTFESPVPGFDPMPVVRNRKSGAVHPFTKTKPETERLPADEQTNREIDKLEDQARRMDAEGDTAGAKIAREQAKRRTDAMIRPASAKKEQTEEEYILANLDRHIEARKSIGRVDKPMTVDEAIAELRDAYRKAKSAVTEDEFELDITTGLLKKKK